LRTGARPLDAGWRQAHPVRALHPSSPMGPHSVFHLAVGLS
jgi:hypothetical protein